MPQRPGVATLDDIDWDGTAALSAPARPNVATVDEIDWDGTAALNVAPTVASAVKDPALGTRIRRSEPVPFGSPVTLRRPGEVVVDPNQAFGPVRRSDEITVVGRGPGTAETIARIPQRIAQGAVAGFQGALAEPAAAAASLAYPAQAPAFQAARTGGIAALADAGLTPPATPTDLSNPQWWAAGLGQAIGSAAGMTAAGGTGAMAAATASTAESLTEASTVYNELIANGTPAPEALKRASATFASNMAVLGLTDVPLFKAGGNLLVRVLSKAAIEGGQEVAQQAISNVATDRPIGEGMTESGAVGAMAGGLFGASPAGHGRPSPIRGLAPAPALEAPLTLPQEAPPGAATRPGQSPITGSTAPRPLPSAPAAPPAAATRPSPITPAAPASVAASLPPEAPAGNTGTTPPDSVRQAIERELGGAVTEDEIASLAAGAFAPSIRGEKAEVTQPAAGRISGVARPEDVIEVIEPPPAPPGRGIKDQAPMGGATPAYRPPTGSAEMEASEPERTGPTDDRPWLERVGEDAVTHGYAGTPKQAAKDADRRAREFYKATHGTAADEGDDRALLEAIRDRGGIAITDKDLAGELKWLQSFKGGWNRFAGVQGVFRHVRERGPSAHRTVGIPMDMMAQSLHADPRFARRELDQNRLIEALTTAAIDHREGRHQRETFDPQHYGEGAGVRLGRRWFRADGPMVRRSDKLSPEAEAVQERFARAIEDDLEGFVGRYREKFGNVIDADKAKELAGEDIETHHEALHAPSSWLADELYDRAVSDQTLDRGLVVFTGGGPGSGKSSSVERSALKGIAAAAVIQRDSAFANPQRAREMLQAARDNGHTPTLFYVYTDPVVAWGRQASRDRTVSLDKFIELHRNAIQTARMMAPELGEDLFILNNSGDAPVLLEDRPAVDIIEKLAQNYPSNADIRARIAASPAPEAGAAAARGSEAPAADTGGSDAREPDRGRPPGPPAERRSSEVVDTLDTGEEQPRLPGDVGAVRNTNIKAATFEAPFTLSGGTETRKAPKDEPLFEPTGGRRTKPGTRIRAAEGTEEAPALPATSDEEGSPTRRAYSEPPPVPAHVKPPRKPISEMQVVARLAQVFGHERRAGVFRRLQGKIPVPVAGGVFGRKAHGFYTLRGQIIRLRKFGDLTTFTHELGHDIDHRIFEDEAPGWRALKAKDKGIATELMTLGAETSPPSATPSYQRGEGVAEYFRVWFVDPAAAKARAPQFTAAFDQILAANPELAKQFEEGRILVQQYLAQDHVQRGTARVDFGTSSTEDPDGTTAWQKFQALMVDDLTALEDAVAHLAADTPIDITKNAYVLARLARGAAAKAGGFLEHGIRADDGTFVSGSLAAALSPVKHDLKGFSTYLVARRAVELRRRNVEPGMKAKEAAAILRKFDSPTFRAAAKAVYTFQNDVLSYATSAGLLTREQQAQIRALNRQYVPYWRVMKASGPGAKRMANRPSIIKRIHGSGRDVVDPLQAIVRNTHALVEAVDQHRAMVAFVKQTQATKGGDLFLEHIPTPQEKTTFNLDQLRKDIQNLLVENNVDAATVIDGRTGKPMLEIEGTPVDLNELVSVFTPQTMATGKDRVISVMHAGKRTFFRVTDPAIFEALTAIGPKATNQATRWAFKILGAPARTLRAGATLTLGFVGRNIVRDSWVARIQSKHGFRPGIDTLRGLFSYLKADEHYQQFLNSGAGSAAMVAQDRNAIVRELRRLTSQGRIRDHAKNVVFHPIDFLRALSEASEMSTRLGQFRRARDTGASLPEAALSARDVTVDFARGGSFTKDANQFIAFFNARIQGYARFAETFRDDPVGASIRTATSVTLLSLALWALNKDDDEYAELPEWEKNTYWHIPIDWLPTLVGGQKLSAHAGYLRIPKPFELGTLFGTMFERAMDQITERDPHAWKRLFVDDPSADASEVAADAAKQGAWDAVSSMVPTALLPMLEAAMNYSTFRQRPIVSPFDKDLPAELQYNRWTSELAKKVGAAIDMPPAIIDHLIYSYGAGLARGVVSDAIDPALQALGGRDRPIAPARSLQSLPGIGAFARDAAGTDAMSIAELYALRDRLRAVPSTVKRYQAEGATEKASAFANRYPNRLVQQRRVNDAAETIKDLRDRVSSIYANKTMTPGAKREQLDRTLEAMVNAARKGLGKPPLPSRF